MARPQADDYAEKQQLIRDRAAELFARRGFAGASIADIAAACDCAKSLIYHYFDSKEAILYDLLQAHVRALLDAARNALAQGGSPEEQFRAFVRAHLELYGDARAKHILLLNELDSLPAARKSSIVALERELVSMAADLLQQLAPDLASKALRMPVAMSFYGLINWTYTWYRADAGLSPSALADLAADLFLRGLPKAVERFPAQPAAAVAAGARGRKESMTMRSGIAPAVTTHIVQSSTKEGAPAMSTTWSNRSAPSLSSSDGMRPRSQRSGAPASRVKVTR